MIPLAYLEQLGWRRFALDRVLRYRSPFSATLLLGMPSAMVHLVILLPGMIDTGAPAVAQSIQLMSLRFFLTWVYLRSGGSVLTATLLHGTQNAFVVLNRRLAMAESNWLSMAVYLVLAIILVIVERRKFMVEGSAIPDVL